MDEQKFKQKVEEVTKDVEKEMSGDVVNTQSKGNAEKPRGEADKDAASDAELSGSAASKAQDDLNRD